MNNLVSKTIWLITDLVVFLDVDNHQIYCSHFIDYVQLIKSQKTRLKINMLVAFYVLMQELSLTYSAKHLQYQNSTYCVFNDTGILKVSLKLHACTCLINGYLATRLNN